MKKMLPYKWSALGSLAGALAGLAYWKFIGCSNGSCSITSVWHNSMLYGAILGWLIIDIFRKTPKTKPHE